MRERFDDNKKLYVGNLNAETTSDDLQSLFGKYGKVANVWVARKPPGFAFVTFDDSRDANDAKQEVDGTDFQGSRLKVEFSRPPRSSFGRKRDPYARGSRRNHSPRYSRSKSGGRARSRSPSYGRRRSRSR